MNTLPRILPLLLLALPLAAPCLAEPPSRVSFEPPAPRIGEAVTLLVRDSKPGGHVRWGVNGRGGSWQAPHPLHWPSETVLIDHGVAVETPLPAPGQDGVSRLVLGPFDGGGQWVRSLHVALRWGKKWDSNQGKNYNVDLDSAPAAGKPGITFVAASTNLTSLPHRLEIEAEGASHVEWWLNGEPLGCLRSPPWEWTFDALPYGRHRVLVVAGGPEGRRLAETELWRQPVVRREPLPEGLAQGASRLDDDRTWGFHLYAPDKRFVSLVGGFNDWDPEATPLAYGGDGSWWTSLELAEGVHEYQYLVEGELQVADPYSVEVAWQDAKGVQSPLPRLARSVLDTRRTWEGPVEGYARPALDQLIIYELHLKDFAGAGGFAALAEKLDYIRDLGATALEPLPIQEFPGGTSWGYNPAFHFAPERAYGSPAELRRLIAAGHERGLAFILDAVLNHTDRGAPVCRLYGDDYDANPYFYVFEGDNWGFPKIDQHSPHFQKLAADYLRFWLETYRVDGFRYDATRWTEWGGAPGEEWGAAGFALAAKRADPQSYQIAEHIPGDPELMKQTEMDAEWDAHFRWRVRETLRTGKIEDKSDLLRVIDPSLGAYGSPWHRMVYTESHDEQRVMRELLDEGYALPEALRRAETALLLTLTVPGIPMVYAGQEFGEDTPKVVGPNPLDWAKLEKPAYARLHERAGELIRLRRDHPALRNGAIRIDHCDPATGILAYTRGAGDEQLRIAVNFSRSPQDYDGQPLGPGEGRILAP